MTNLTKTAKFVKRYPRAIIRKSAHTLRLYIVSTPGEAPGMLNRVDVTHPRESLYLHTKAICKIEELRSEPS